MDWLEAHFSLRPFPLAFFFALVTEGENPGTKKLVIIVD